MKNTDPDRVILLLFLIQACTGEGGKQPYPAGSMEYPERAVTHIWLTMFGGERGFPRSAVLRIYWDGRDEPAVESPVGDFFAVGHGMQVDLTSSRVAISSFGRAYNCYWNMPFRKAARITVTNESSTHELGLYFYIDWEERKVPADVPYFHAQYRQENPVREGTDYLIADIEGEGHYAGTVLSVRNSQPGWFGEGDDRFYIDGDTLPTMHGTGSEDYINDAWAFRYPGRGTTWYLPAYGQGRMPASMISTWTDGFLSMPGTSARNIIS